MIDEALWLASQGLAVFPIMPNGKRPLHKGWQATASTDAGTVRRVFGASKLCNIAVATGEASHAFVLDIDRKTVDGAETLRRLEQDHGGLPPTWRADTPSGGFHLYFRLPRLPAVSNRVNVRPGLDVRGAGGYVVAPPSRLPAGEYKWSNSPSDVPLSTAPDWLLHLVTRPQHRLRAEGLDISDEQPPTRLPLHLRHRGELAQDIHVVNELVREVRAVEAAVAGTRNDRLFRAAAHLGEYVATGRLPEDLVCRGLELAAMCCGLTSEGEAAVRSTIESGLRRGRASRMGSHERCD